MLGSWALRLRRNLRYVLWLSAFPGLPVFPNLRAETPTICQLLTASASSQGQVTVRGWLGVGYHGTYLMNDPEGKPCVHKKGSLLGSLSVRPQLEFIVDQQLFRNSFLELLSAGERAELRSGRGVERWVVVTGRIERPWLFVAWRADRNCIYGTGYGLYGDIPARIYVEQITLSK